MPMTKLYGKEKWRLVHDNARIHAGKLTQDFLKASQIPVIQHLPYSPDLNPIERVWAHLKKKIMVRAYERLYKIIDILTVEWVKIHETMLESLINGHCDRVARVYESAGDFPI